MKFSGRKGFALLEILIVVAILAAAGGGAWYFTGSSKSGGVTPQAGIAAEQAAQQAAQIVASSTAQEQAALDAAGENAAPATVTVTNATTTAGGATTHVTSHTTTTVSTDPLAGLGSNIYASGVLPLGDGKYVTSAPKKGYVYLCNVMTGGEGAQENGPWIGTATWNSNTKAVVAGATSWPNASIKISVSGGTRTIVTNDLPTVGTTGNFPIASTDPAHQYDQNPNSTIAQNLTFSLPASPTAAATPGCIYGEVGVMTNGVVLLDAFDAEYRDAGAHEIQDSCEGHPHESGVYHYHSLSSCIPNATVTNIIGWAFDGYPITGPEISAGRYLTTSDLDACHGITSSIMENGALVSTYHYVMTEDFPYSISCFHGKSYEPHPDGSGMSGMNMGTSGSASTQGAAGAGGGTTSGGTPPAPPQAAIDACTGKSSGAACTVGPGSGTCTTIGTYFACKPQ